MNSKENEMPFRYSPIHIFRYSHLLTHDRRWQIGMYASLFKMELKLDSHSSYLLLTKPEKFLFRPTRRIRNVNCLSEVSIRKDGLECVQAICRCLVRSMRVMI